MKYVQITLVMVLFFGFVLLTNLFDITKISAFFSEHGDDMAEKRLSTDSANANLTSFDSQSAAPSSNSTETATTATATTNETGSYKDGEYTGSVEDAHYGYVQVKAVISGGKISDVVFLEYPTHNRTSDYINSQAMPLLTAAAISAQSANVSKVSGASATSRAFNKSLESALSQAI